MSAGTNAAWSAMLHEDGLQSGVNGVNAISVHVPEASNQPCEV